MKTWIALFGLMGAVIAISAGTFALMHRPRVEQDDRWVEGYSAEVRFTDLRDPSKSYHGFVYSNVLSQPRAFRIDMEFADHQRVHIWRQETGMLLVLDPDSKTYWHPRVERSARLVLSSTNTNGVKKLLGRENVNGRVTDHWEITSVDGVVEELWEDVLLHVTVKSTKPGLSCYELVNVREGRQKDELFMVPQEYRKVQEK
jgi:hypothetical protein